MVTFVQGADAPSIHRELIHRHVAWLTALRHQLRTPRPWEHDLGQATNPNRPRITERPGTLCTSEMAQYLAPAELHALEHQSNMAAQLLKTQSVRLQQLREAGYFEDFRHMEFHRLIAEFYGEQGRAERIKNFPFPRQYASTALWLTLVFALFVPLSMVAVFPHSGGWTFWLSPLLSGIIIWVFFLMEMIGDYSENPFEGTYNDVPITSISRTIEIDLREMIGDTNIPAPVQAENGFLM